MRALTSSRTSAATPLYHWCLSLILMRSAAAWWPQATTAARAVRPAPRGPGLLLRHRATAALPSDDHESTHPSAPALLLDPMNHSEPWTYPKSLSPSSIATFQSCPQSFLFQYILKLEQRTTLALLKGRVTHSALEQLFDLPPKQRTLEHAQNLLRKCWSQIRTPEHLQLFEEEQKSEIVWGRECLQLLENYMRVEDPMSLVQPAQREVWVRAVLSSGTDEGVLVRGIVDRLDLVRSAQGHPAFGITDYKTGKAPVLKYSPACNQRIRNEAFFQLQIYALLLEEMRRNKSNVMETNDSSERALGFDVSETLPVTQLRLLYLTSAAGHATVWEDTVGDLMETKEQVLTVWNQIRELVDGQDPTAFVGCNRSFCYCHKCRTMFQRGSVWEPSMSLTR